MPPPSRRSASSMRCCSRRSKGSSSYSRRQASSTSISPMSARSSRAPGRRSSGWARAAARVARSRPPGRRRRARSRRRASRAPAVLLHISGPADLSLREVRQAAEEIRATADPRANVIFGASIGEVPEGEVHITLIATGLDSHRRAEPLRAATDADRPPDTGSPARAVRRCSAAAPATATALAAPATATWSPATPPSAPSRPPRRRRRPLLPPTASSSSMSPSICRHSCATRPTSGTGRRREPRKSPSPTGSRPG